jgi:hypothetical protein
MNTVKRDRSPPADAVRAAFERIATSGAFRASPRLVAFLRFIVETTLCGHADEIKAYTVATAALGRPDTFDPIADAIVRVEAGRLRRALARYYENEGAEDPVVIGIPRGHYVPIFGWRAAPGARRDAASLQRLQSAWWFDRQVETLASSAWSTATRMETELMIRERRLLSLQCDRNRASLHVTLENLRAEIELSQSIVEKSRQLVERSGGGRP